MSRFLRVIKVYPPPPSTYSGTMSINHPDERERGERHPISLRAREDNLKGALASSLADSDPLLIRRRANKCWHRGQAGIAGIAGRQASRAGRQAGSDSSFTRSLPCNGVAAGEGGDDASFNTFPFVCHRVASERASEQRRDYALAPAPYASAAGAE